MKSFIKIFHGFLIVVLFSLSADAQAKITVLCDYYQPDDTLELQIFDKHVRDEYEDDYIVLVQPVFNGKAVFVLDSVNEYTRFTLAFSFQKQAQNKPPAYPVLAMYPVDKADDITLQLTPVKGGYVSSGNGDYINGAPIFSENWHCYFSGKGAGKYNVRFNALRFSGDLAQRKQQYGIHLPQGELRLRKVLNQLDSMMLLTFDYVDRFLPHLNKYEANLIKADAVGSFGYKKNRLIESYYDFLLRTKSDDTTISYTKKIFTNYYKKQIEQQLKDWGSQVIVHAPKYLYYYSRMLEFEHYLNEGNYQTEKLYDYIRKEVLPDKQVSDWLVTTMLSSRYQYSSDLTFHQRIMQELSDPYCRLVMEQKGNLSRGKKALDFSLPDAGGIYHTLSSLRGKVVFVDFWYMSCYACRLFKHNVLQHIVADFKDNKDIVFVTVSIDDKATFLKALSYNDFLPEGSLHLYTDGQLAQHPIIKNYGISGYPSPMLIDRKGDIRYTKELRNLDKFKEAVNELLAE